MEFSSENEFGLKMNYFVVALLIGGLVAGQSTDKNETSSLDKNDSKTPQLMSVLEGTEDQNMEKSQQKRELYEDDEETKFDSLMEKRMDGFEESEEMHTPMYSKDKLVADKKVLYKSSQPSTNQRPYYHDKPYVVEVPVPYPVPVPKEEYEKEFHHPHLSKYDVEGEMYAKEPLGGKYHKIVAAHYGEYNPYEDTPDFKETEHFLPGYLYHLHMKHQGVGHLYENRDSAFEYGSGYPDEDLPPLAVTRTHYPYAFRDYPNLDRRSQYTFAQGHVRVNPDLEHHLDENFGSRRTLNSGYGYELTKSSRYPPFYEAPRHFYPGHLLESMHKGHPVESRQVRPSALFETQQQSFGDDCQGTQLKKDEQVLSPTTTLFPPEGIFHRTEQELNQKSTPEMSVKLHQTLVALKKAEQEKEAIDQQLHHIHLENDAKLHHGLQALEKANQEKHIIEKAVHHNIMQKEDNDVKLHQSLSALKLAEHQKQAIELELHKTQMEKEAKIKQELAALKKAEQEKQMIEQQLHQLAEKKTELQKPVMKEVKLENKLEKTKTQEVVPKPPTKAVLIVDRPVVPILPVAAEKEMSLKKEQTNVPKEDPAKKQLLASLLKQSSLVIGAIKEEKKDEGLLKTANKM